MLVGVGGCLWVLVGVVGCWRVLAGVGGCLWVFWLKIIVAFLLRIGCPLPLLPPPPNSLVGNNYNRNCQNEAKPSKKN